MAHLRRELGMFVVLALMCTGIYLSNHDFKGADNIGNLFRNTAMLGTFAVGMAFVIITGGIDLSVGSLIGLTGVLIAKFGSSDEGCYHWPIGLAILAAVAIVLVMGLIQGLIITQLNLQPFIVTLAGLLIFRGLAQTICDGGNLSLSDTALKPMANGGFFMVHGSALISWPLLIFVASLLVFGYVLHLTVFGRYVYAIGGNRDAARYSGINVKLMETMTYVISAGMAAIAGICYASYVGGMTQDVGRSYELYAIAACVLGGCSLRGGEGTIVGVLIGSAIYQVMYNGINMFKLGTWRLNTNWTEWIIGLVILLAVAGDQVAHIVQAARRTRKPKQPQPAGGFPVAPPTPA